MFELPFMFVIYSDALFGRWQLLWQECIMEKWEHRASVRRNWSAKTGSEALVERDGSNSSRNKRHQFVAAKKRYSHEVIFLLLHGGGWYREYCALQLEIHLRGGKLGIYRQQDQVYRIRSVRILNSSHYFIMLLYQFFEKDTPRPCPSRPWCSCWREGRGKVDPGEHEHGGHWRRPAVFFQDCFPIDFSLIVLEIVLTGSDLWLTDNVMLTKDNS